MKSTIMSVDKSKLVEQIKQQLASDFEILKAAAIATYEDATHEESKPENEYDTRGLEASYLAGAQGKRLQEMEEVFASYKLLNVKKFTEKDPIGLSALVEVEFNSKISYIFIVPKGGGLTIPFEDTGVQLNIQIVASTSPLGEALLGTRVGEVAVIDVGFREVEYEILSIA